MVCWFQIALALFALKKAGAPICKISGKHSEGDDFFNRLFFSIGWVFFFSEGGVYKGAEVW